jgi:WD40 repeat protein/energy-coupling factor transporter ATP-binding protein EcfA2
VTQHAQGPEIAANHLDEQDPRPAEDPEKDVKEPPQPQAATPQAQAAECPYLSLRYFEERDSYLFYGRDEHVRELLSKLELNRFVAVLGSSGCGKSSLVRAGLLPELKSGMIPAAGHRWKVIEFKPGSSPMQELGSALERGLGISNATDIVAEGPLGIARAVDSASLEADTNILIIADQFEEIFAYLREEQSAGRGHEAQEQARALVRRLLDAAAEPNLRIYVLMVMRSDYLGDCVQFPDLPERMNASLYLVPRLRRDQLQRAIEAPVGRDIEPAVVQRLLGEVGTDPDQLPRLQHLLSRMWSTAEGKRLTFAHYTAVGGWKRGLEQHLDQIYEGLYVGLAPAEQEACRLVFQRLSEMDRGRAVRRWATRQQLVALAGPEAEDVVKRFHREGFLRLSGRNLDTYDVMHESVLRGWPRLASWMEQESRNFGRLRELVRVTREAGWRPGMTAAEKSSVEGIAGLTLKNLVEWRNAFHPTGVWASRYIDAGEFEIALNFLNWSEAQEIKREKAERAARLRAWTLLAALFVVALAAAVWGLYQAKRVAKVSTSFQLAADSAEDRSTDPEKSVLLAAYAVNAALVDNLPSKPAAATALHSAILSSQVRQAFRGHKDKVESVAYSPDGTRLATGSDDQTAKIWDAETSKELMTLSGHTGAIQSVAFSPDGKRLATGSDDKTAKIWDTKTGKELLTLTGHTGPVKSVAFSPDGSRLATGSDDKTARIWDTKTGKPLMTLSGHTNKVEWVAFSPDGRRLATGSDDETARIWDAQTGKPLMTLRRPSNTSGLEATVESVAFSPDGKRLATGSDDKTATIWDAGTGQVLTTLRGHEAVVEAVAFSPDGKRLATASLDNTTKIWDAGTGDLLTTLNGYKDRFESVAFSPDGKRLATASDNKTATIWDPEPLGTEVMTLREKIWATSVVFSPDGKRLANGSDDNTAKIWDAETGKEVMTLSGHTDWVFSVAFSPDGRRVATASYDNTAKIWDARTGKDLMTLRGHNDAVTSVAFSPDSKLLATASADKTAKIWDAETGKLLKTLSGHGARVRSVAFSPDSRRLATGTGSDDNTAKIWDADTGKELLTLSGHQGFVYSVAFSPDGRRLATASADGTAKVWDADTGKLLMTLVGHKSTVYSIVFSSDGKLLATGSNDQTAMVWDAASGKEMMTLRGHQGEVRAVAFSPDGKRLASASADATVQVYDVDLHDLLTLAHSRVTFPLTSDECKLYFGSSTCPKLP